MYADFLDDRDEPTHAAAVRHDVALAAEPPWADHYWQLLDAASAVPAGYPSLAARRPLLCGCPADVPGRWRAVRAFVRRWWGVPLGDLGRGADAVHAAEGSAGRRLPAAAREWAAFAAEFESLPRVGYGGIRDTVRYERGYSATSLLEIGEGGVWWAVRDQDKGDDPPVWACYSPEDPNQPPMLWQDWAGSAAEFALGYLLSNRRGPDEHEHSTDDPATAVARLRPHFPVGGPFGRLRVLERPGAAAVVVSPDPWTPDTNTVYVLARDPAELQELQAALGS